MDSKNVFDKIKFKELGKYMNHNLQLPNFKEINGKIYKLCTKCKKYKPMTEKYFPKRNNVKCKFGSHCKECEHEKETHRIRKSAFDDAGNLYCCTCKQYKPVSEFNRGSKNKTRLNYSRECKHCESERKKIKLANANCNNKNRFLTRLTYGCKTRALQHKLDYDLTPEFIISLYDKQKGKCALSGIEMTTIIQSGKNTYNASIDRIIPSLGYIKTNVRLVCSQVNMMRSNLEDFEIINICKAIINYAKLKQSK